MRQWGPFHPRNAVVWIDVVSKLFVTLGEVEESSLGLVNVIFQFFETAVPGKFKVNVIFQFFETAVPGKLNVNVIKKKFFFLKQPYLEGKIKVR